MILIVLSVVIVLLSSCNEPTEPIVVDNQTDTPDIPNSNKTDIHPPQLSGIVRTTGTYTCPTCPEPQEWYIGEDHILYWEGEPYIPHFINDFLWNYETNEMDHLLNTGGSIEDLKKSIDEAFNRGIKDFTLEVSYFGADDADLADQRIMAATEHINAGGGQISSCVRTKSCE